LGFGGSVAALRAAEKGYRLDVMESGRRWNDDDLPKSQWHRLTLSSPRPLLLVAP
jgi:cholesterol oxidase